MKKVRVCVITGFGVNADVELACAFNKTGGSAERVHIRDLIADPDRLDEYAITAFPGGFSFGDHLGSGKVFASLFKKHLQEKLSRFVADGKLVIGICNGFQTLVKMGILPNLSGDWSQETSLIHNDSGRFFEDRWVNLGVNSSSPCVWTTGIEKMELPVRHGEGRFVVRDAAVADALITQNLAVCYYRSFAGGPAVYPENPNGSLFDIAGITDRTGRIFGLMPHPEAFLVPENHPRWTREKRKPADGLFIFDRGINFIKNNL